MRDIVRFTLDGVLHEVRNPDPTLTLLRYLRSDLRRTGTKEGCAEGDCGACTVALADGAGAPVRAVNACIVFLPMIDGAQLTTVESLAADGVLHPIQQALVEHHGSQCGFCTPGFVMALYAHFASGGGQSTAEINDAIAGNLCRCTGYGPILAAAQSVEIPDPGLRAAIRTALNKPSGNLTIADMEMMRQLQAADTRRLQDALFGMLDLVGSLSRSQMRTDETVNSLAEDFSRLTERLNIFINVVERFISGNGGAESSA